MLLIPSNSIDNTKTGNGYKLGELNQGVDTLGYLTSNCQTLEVEGVGNFLALLPEVMPMPKKEKASTINEDGWAGGYSYVDALDVFTRNPSKVRLFTELDTRLNGGDANGLRNEYDVTGDTLDVGKYLDGEPEVFASLTDGQPRGKRVHIALNMSAGSSTNSADMLARQKRIVRLVDWLETQQIRVKLTGIASSFCAHTEIVAKQYHEPLDLNDIAVLSHPSFFRRLYFRVLEYSKTWQMGYSSARDFNAAMISHPNVLDSGDTAETVVYIGSNYMGIEPKFDALEAELATNLAAGNNATLSVLT